MRNMDIRMAGILTTSTAVLFALQFVILINFYFVSADSSSFRLSKSLEDMLNRCMDSDYHKTAPGVEDALHQECVPWKDRSCCTAETSKKLHENYHYNFDYNHCFNETGVNMSSACYRHFVKDTCFYECEPNIGPWLVKVNRKLARERFVNVPLCASDCEAWWKDCRNDYTCVYNWPRNFQFRNGRNYCPEGSRCLRFNEVYKNAQEFCENVWDMSWSYVPDNEPCMRIWFNGSVGNPNRFVAEWYISTHFNHASNKEGSVSYILLFLVNFIITCLLVR